MSDNHKAFWVLFVVQLVSYTLPCINYRAVAQAHYLHSAVSDFAIASLNFFVIKRIAQGTDNLSQWAGYALGSVAGSFAGIWLSKEWLGG